MVGCNSKLRECVDINGVTLKVNDEFALPTTYGTNGWEVYIFAGLRNPDIVDPTLMGKRNGDKHIYPICGVRIFKKSGIILNEYNKWQYKK